VKISSVFGGTGTDGDRIGWDRGMEGHDEAIRCWVVGNFLVLEICLLHYGSTVVNKVCKCWRTVISTSTIQRLHSSHIHLSRHCLPRLPSLISLPSIDSGMPWTQASGIRPPPYLQPQTNKKTSKPSNKKKKANNTVVQSGSR
jgi:hypothetical protein